MSGTSSQLVSAPVQVRIQRNRHVNKMSNAIWEHHTQRLPFLPHKSALLWKQIKSYHNSNPLGFIYWRPTTHQLLYLVQLSAHIILTIILWGRRGNGGSERWTRLRSQTRIQHCCQEKSNTSWTLREREEKDGGGGGGWAGEAVGEQVELLFLFSISNCGFFLNLENRVTFIIKQKLLNSLIWEDTCMETANPLKANTQPAWSKY